MSSSLKSSGGEDARSVPILFLDIDGVLNRTATAPQINLEQDKVDRLKGVLGIGVSCSRSGHQAGRSPGSLQSSSEASSRLSS